jgi:hypothetical protein
MRLSPLFLSVLLFVTATEFAAAEDGAGEVTTQSAQSRRAERQLSRQLQRAHRAEQLNALRDRFGQGARTGDAPAATQERLQSILMILPEGDPGTGAEGELLVTDVTDELGEDVSGFEDDSPVYLGPPIQIDPNSEGGEGFWEGFPVEDDEIGEDDGPKIKPWWRGGDDPMIYTLSGAAAGELQNRNHNGPGNAAQHAPFAPLEALRGAAAGTPAATHVPDVLPSPQTTTGAAGRFDLTRADRILAKRLADIDHLRDVALKNGNLKLLDQADKLEQVARTQYERRTGTTPTPEPQPEPPATDPVSPTPDPVQPPVDETPTPGVEEPLSELTP